MKLSRRIGALALSLSGLAFAAGAQAADVVRIGGTSNYGPVLPVVAAQELKLFDKVGVNAKFTGFPGGSAEMEALAANEVDIINYFRRVLRCARPWSEGDHHRRGLAYAARLGRDRQEGFADQVVKRIWRARRSAYPPPAPRRISSASGRPIRPGGQVNRIPVGGPGMVPNLLSGNVDAIVAYPPLSYKVCRRERAEAWSTSAKRCRPTCPMSGWHRTISSRRTPRPCRTR